MRLAILGCGDAAVAMALASRFVRRVRVAVCVDLDASKARGFSRWFPASRALTDWKALLGDPGTDAVYVALPHALHREAALELAAAGKAVLLEKPLAENVTAGEAILAGLPPEHRVGVNYQYRYDRKAWALVEAARSGQLGEIRYVTAEVPWHREDAYLASAPWHASLSLSGGGTLLTQGSHVLDIALLCAGGKPVAAMGTTWRRQFTGSEVEDLAAGQVETAGGAPVIAVSSMIARPGFRASIRVYGSRGAAVYQGPSRPSLRGYGVRLTSPPVLSQLGAYRSSLAGFRDWVEGGPAYRCTANDAMAVLSAVDGVYRSAESGRRVVLTGGIND